MELRECSEGSVTVIAVRGRLDSATSPALGACLSRTLPAPQGRLLLELSQLDCISSAGFRTLLLATKRATDSQGRIVLAGVSGKVRELFDLAGLLEILPVCATRDEGVAALR